MTAIYSVSQFSNLFLPDEGEIRKVPNEIDVFITRLDGIYYQIEGKILHQNDFKKGIPLLHQFIHGYFLEKVLGKGLSIVYLCTKDYLNYAMKFFNDLPMYEYESGTLKTFMHKCPEIIIPNIYAFLETMEFGFIFMEYFPLTLSHRSQLSNDKFFKYTKQLLQWLEMLHNKGGLHCDIKPYNLCINAEDDLRIIDYGLINNLDCSIDGLVASPFYRHPYIYRAVGERMSYTTHIAIDMWAVGMSLLEMMNGGFPQFVREVSYRDSLAYAEHLEKVDYKTNISVIVEKALSNTVDQKIFKNLLSLLLEVDVTKTISATEALMVLNPYATIPCKYFSKGFCRNGDNCQFSHQTTEFCGKCDDCQNTEGNLVK